VAHKIDGAVSQQYLRYHLKFKQAFGLKLNYSIDRVGEDIRIKKRVPKKSFSKEQPDSYTFDRDSGPIVVSDLQTKTPNESFVRLLDNI